MVKKSLFSTFILLFILCSCNNDKESQFDYVSFVSPQLMSKEKDAKGGLWLVFSDFEKGTLGRIDLDRGKVEWSVLPIGSDTVLIPDQENSFWILTRMTEDSVNLAVGPEAVIDPQTIALEDGANPSHALRDSQGNIWVSQLNSNELNVYSQDTGQLIKEIDLSPMKHEDDRYAHNSFILDLNDKFIAVFANRIDRNHASNFWVPRPQSAIGFIDKESLELVNYQLLDLTNIKGAFKKTVKIDKEHDEQRVVVVASGDLTGQTDRLGQVAEYTINDNQNGKVEFELVKDSARNLSDNIVTYDVDRQGRVYTLRWSQLHSKSCLFRTEIYPEEEGNSEENLTEEELAAKKRFLEKKEKERLNFGHEVFCQKAEKNGGYAFHDMKVHSDGIAFLAYSAEQKSELWIVYASETDTNRIRSRIPMKLPLMQLHFGQ